MDEEKRQEWFKEDLLFFRRNGAKIVTKPWGMEVWLREPTEEEKINGNGYCYKRIYLSAGNRTSLQYHEKKFETNYVIKGEAEVWLQDEQGETSLEIDGKRYAFSVTQRGPNYFFDVVPPRIHRIRALTDLVLQEVSNPFVDDVIRLQDDARRGSGKIESEHKKDRTL